MCCWVISRFKIFTFISNNIEFVYEYYRKEALRANIDWKSAFLKGVGPFEQKFQIQGDDPANHSSCRGIRIWTEYYFVLLVCMRLTDGRTESDISYNVLQ